jgi:hydrogenase maturation protease
MKIKSSHQIDLPQVLGLAKALDIKIPDEIIIFGVEAEDITTFTIKCTKAVESAIPRLVKLICSELKHNDDKLNSKSLEIIN